MKVKELIAKLQDYNPDAIVMINQQIESMDEVNMECSPLVLYDNEIETLKKETLHRKASNTDWDCYNPTPDQEDKQNCTHILLTGETK
jgi:hypothetical protein